ncbi:MAG: aminotransferase class IV [Candidatus Omnitrophota bacterium]
MRRRIMFLDGMFIPASETMTKTLSPGLLTGRGVFETMRAYNGSIFAFHEHCRRLFEGLRKLNIEAPCSQEKMQGYLYCALRSNKLKNGRLRLTIWQSKQGPRMSVIATEYHPFSKTKYREGFKTVVSSLRRDERHLSCDVKSIEYLPLFIERRKAKTKGKDEAILLNRKGYICEGSYTNIFLIKDKILYTPSLACGCLKGITRQFVLKIAKETHLPCKEMQILLNQLLGADEAFLTNSLLEIMPLTFVGNKRIGQGQAGPLTKLLSSKYHALTQE